MDFNAKTNVNQALSHKNATKRLKVNDLHTNGDLTVISGPVSGQSNDDICSPSKSKSGKQFVVNDEDMRAKFDYFMSNINKYENSGRLEIIDIEDDLPNDCKTFKDEDLMTPICKRSLSQVSDVDCEDFNDYELKSMAQNKIRNGFTDEENKRIKMSLDSISDLKDIDLDHICYLVNEWSDSLKDICFNDKNPSLYKKLFNKNGFIGVMTQLKCSVHLRKRQQIYLMGSLDGLIGQLSLKSFIYSVLFAECLVKILVRVKKVTYKQALDLVNPLI